MVNRGTPDCQFNRVNPYTVLGANEKTNKKELRRIYYWLVHKYNQWLNEDKTQGEKLKEITWAYKLLTNPEKKYKWWREDEPTILQHHMDRLFNTLKNEAPSWSWTQTAWTSTSWSWETAQSTDKKTVERDYPSSKANDFINYIFYLFNWPQRPKEWSMTYAKSVWEREKQRIYATLIFATLLISGCIAITTFKWEAKWPKPPKTEQKAKDSYPLERMEETLKKGSEIKLSPKELKLVQKIVKKVSQNIPDAWNENYTQENIEGEAYDMAIERSRNWMHSKCTVTFWKDKIVIWINHVSTHRKNNLKRSTPKDVYLVLERWD